MMAHVWNEIEHNIGYKPEGEGPSDAERGLLETLGHLTRAGDAAITRLLAANIARMTVQTGDFVDVHDFVARLRPSFPDADLSVNAGPAFDAAMILGLSSVERSTRPPVIKHSSPILPPQLSMPSMPISSKPVVPNSGSTVHPQTLS